MSRIYFSLKKLNISIYLFITLTSIVIIFLIVLFFILNYTLLSYTKGSKLLITYFQNYALSIYNKELFTNEEKEEIEKKIQGFYAFYELLFSMERNDKEIEKLWLDFGMTKQEIQLVLLGTKALRNFPIMDKIKSISKELKNKLDEIEQTKLLEKENMKNVLYTLDEFSKSFYSTMSPILAFVLLISSVLIISILIFFGYYLIKNLIPLNKIIELMSKRIKSILERESFTEIDLIDPRSECVVLQDSVNAISRKFENIDFLKKQILSITKETLQTIDEEIDYMKTKIETIKELEENMVKIEESKIIKSWEIFTKSFSSIDSYIKSIINKFENLRNTSVRLFEPISTIYEIIEKASTKYKLIKDLSLKHISESVEISKSITRSLDEAYQNTIIAFEELKRISTNLRSIGINTTIEFSRISSSDKSLTNIGSKIVKISKDLSKIFVDTESQLEQLKTEIKQDINKLLSFSEAINGINKELEEISSVISGLSREKDKTIDDINSSYKSLSEIIELLSDITEENEKILRNFFEMENMFKIIIENLKQISVIKEISKYIVETYEFLKTISSSISEQINKINEI
ncbi:MAG: hypothetical protein ACK4F9_05110 [Brevinematia bacterium]